MKSKQQILSEGIKILAILDLENGVLNEKNKSHFIGAIRTIEWILGVEDNSSSDDFILAIKKTTKDHNGYMPEYFKKILMEIEEIK